MIIKSHSLSCHYKQIAENKSQVKIYLYKQADWEGINKYIQPILEPLVHSKSPAEEIWEKFKTILKEAAIKYIPSKFTKSHPSRPWMSKQPADKIKLIDRLYKKGKDNGKAGIEEHFKSGFTTNQQNQQQDYIQQQHNATHHRFYPQKSFPVVYGPSSCPQRLGASQSLCNIQER